MTPLKIALIGSCNSGKTSFVELLHGKRAPPSWHATIGIDLKYLIFEGQTLYLYDVGGYGRFQDLVYDMCRKNHCQVYLLFYNQTNPESLTEMLRHLDWVKKEQPHARYYLVGTKSDLPGPHFTPTETSEQMSLLNEPYKAISLIRRIIAEQSVEEEEAQPPMIAPPSCCNCLGW